MHKHAIILPLKETFSKKSAGAVSIWVKDYLSKSKLKKNIYIFTQDTNESLIQKKNVYKIKINKKFFTNATYIQSVLNILEEKKFKSIEIHNRPEYLKYFKFSNKIKIHLIFHNDPNKLRGSSSTNEKNELLQKCSKIIFVSKFLKKKFFENLDFDHANNVEIIYNSINKIKKFPNKKKIIIFSGKLNSLKGYDVFGKTIIKILDKNPEWTGYVFGNEPREKYNFKHNRLFIKNWISHEKLLKFYEKSSISIVIPKWQEPFGRTAMESASRGCAVITSLSGGLQETFNNNLILKNITVKNLFKKIQKLIDNPDLLRSIQIENFKNVIHLLDENAKKIDNLLEYDQKSFFYQKTNKKKRIMQISTFGERSNYRIYNLSIAKKLSNGFIRNGHDIINIDHRNRPKFDTNKKFEEKIFNTFLNYRPDLLLFGHNNSLSRQFLKKIKHYGCKIAIWYEDALANGGPDFQKSLLLLEKNRDLIDKYFVTTNPNSIKTKIKKNKIFFMPVPADPNIEYGEFYKEKKTYDLFFALSHGVNLGILKKNYIDDRVYFINKLLKYSGSVLKFFLIGLYNMQPIWNFDYDNQLRKSKIALNLSRGKPVKYYSSNRIAQLMGNGCVVAIDKKVMFQDFFSNREMIFYKNSKDLIIKIKKIKDNKKLLYEMGRVAKKKYFKMFSNKIVSQYIIDRIFGFKNFYKYVWK